MKTNLRRLSRANSGFSLVEIVVAVGIVATVMVALLGMIPTGLNTVNEAADKMAEIRIAQQVLGEVQMTDFEDADNWKQQRLYFDGDGNRLKTNDVLKTRYVCRIDIDKNHELPGQDPSRYDFVKQVVVKIGKKRGTGSINWSDDAPRGEYSRYTSLNVMTKSAKEVFGF